MVVEEWISLEHWWDDSDEKPWVVLNTMSQRHFVHHKSHWQWPGIDLSLHSEVALIAWAMAWLP
jgi:hypothetical protein